MGRVMKETLSCECVLTESERLAYGKQLAAEMSKVARLKARMSAFRSQIKAEMESHQGRMNMLSEKLNSGCEYRDLECQIRYDWNSKEKVWIRPDTYEVVKQDIIPERELQEEMRLASEAAHEDGDGVTGKDKAAGDGEGDRVRGEGEDE